MKLDVLVYCPLKEEEEQEVKGWSKSTIDYINRNRAKVTKTIRNVAKGMCKHSLQTADVDDIFSEILLYLYKSDDYNISKAIDRSSSGMIVSLEGYINTCVKYCVMRYLTVQYNTEKESISETIDEDGKELSIFDTIPDDRTDDEYDRILYDLRQQCSMNECMRYKYGPDIYMILYVRLLTLSDKSGEVYKDVLNILGISKKELANIEKNSSEDDLMTGFAKAISNSGVDEAIEILEEYIYSADKIKEVINY